MTTQNVEVPRLEARIRLHRHSSERSELLGYADLVVAGSFVIKDIRIITAKTGENAGRPFISFPSRRGTGATVDKFFDVAHPITSEAFQAANEAILQAYSAAGGSA